MRRGFTVLEVLVVLVIVGLISLTLFEALGRVAQVGERMSPFLARSERQAIAAGWLRRSINQLVPARRSEKPFAGTATGFTGLSLAPLDESMGAPTPVAWAIATRGDAATLTYTGRDGRAVPVLGLVSTQAHFAYLARDVTWHESWPVPGETPAPGQPAPQLPLAVALLDPGAGGVPIVGVVRGAREPLPDVTQALSVLGGTR